ncbi:MAG: RagB/SusD family nutrient uptake outer membrane protein [Bacteroidetes bacterium]|nr:MAG: RagB/SusD family nutrient uptake outer membrane protein [Bacteroidota bacterium]
MTGQIHKTMRELRIILAGLMLLALGCSEDFLEVQNYNQLSESSFYQTEQDFEDLLITCYMPIGHLNQGAAINRIGYAIDDRVVHEQFNLSALQYDATNGDINNIYAALYRGLMRCNLFLDKFSEEIDVDPARRVSMLGEAHFLRGMYLFYIGTYFEVAPLLTAPAEDPRKGYPNSTQEELYAQAASDFQVGISNLPVVWPDEDLGRATQGAAKAFLGRTYLYGAKFSEAAATLKELIDDGTYSLNMPQGTDSLDYIWSYLANFTSIDLPYNGRVYRSEHNSESIYEVNFSTSYDEGARSSQYLILRRSTGSHMTWYNGYSNITGGYGNLAMDDDVFPDEFEKPANHPAGLKVDPRYYAIYIDIGDTLDFRQDNPLSQQVFRISDLNSSLGTRKGMRKYLWPFHTTYTWPNAPFQDPNNVRLMRYGDVLLMYAEAAFRATGNSGGEPLAALNQVRERVGMPPIAALSRDAIIHERDIEMACEHSRFWDIARWYKDGWLTLDEIQVWMPNYQPRHTAFPIPQGEINRHYGVLKQNPKWL